MLQPKTESEAAPAPVAAPTPAPAPVAAPAPAAPAPAPVAAPAAAPQIQISPDSIAALTGMGFPEAEVRAALQAAMGNPDLAYEFLLTGIPEQRTFQRFPAAAAAASPTQTAAPAAALSGVQQLRNHPQFNMLKQLIQTNPASLPQVLNLIGQQNPALLQPIHANEQEFLALLNEPISNNPAPAPAQATAPAPTAGAPGGAPNPADIIALLSAMPAAQRTQFAQSMGLSPDQLNMAMQMMSSMPPEQLQALMGGMGGLGRGAGGPPPGTITLTHEEMESVNRLMALGFSQQQAAQAFIACDRNENLAANFLFENGWGEDGGDFGDMPHDHEGDEGHDHDDDMYN
jgi:UV excision repair protein RAD23